MLPRVIHHKGSDKAIHQQNDCPPCKTAFLDIVGKEFIGNFLMILKEIHSM